MEDEVPVVRGTSCKTASCGDVRAECVAVPDEAVGIQTTRPVIMC